MASALKIAIKKKKKKQLQADSRCMQPDKGINTVKRATSTGHSERPWDKRGRGPAVSEVLLLE
jgi:ribosomal protein L13E